MRRVVVTGMGLVTPLADGVEQTWAKLLDGQSGAGHIQGFDTEGLTTKYACEVPLGDGSDGTFNADAYMAPKEQRKVDTFILFGIAAAQQAIEDAGWTPTEDEDLERTGVLIGSGIGGLNSIANTAVTSRLIQYGDADVMIAGGAEAAICKIGMAGFNACKALSTKYDDDPKAASRPWDTERDGFVMGEGAGIVVLEEYEHAKARGAKIYGEVLGYGLSGDAHHITAPPPDHEGAERAMRAACRNAKIEPSQINYVNAHGTSTMADTIELGAVERLVGDAADGLVMSSTKSATGHLLGAAGAIEAIFTVATHCV